MLYLWYGPQALIFLVKTHSGFHFSLLFWGLGVHLSVSLPYIVGLTCCEWTWELHERFPTPPLSCQGSYPCILQYRSFSCWYFSCFFSLSFSRVAIRDFLMVFFVSTPASVPFCHCLLNHKSSFFLFPRLCLALAFSVTPNEHSDCK